MAIGTALLYIQEKFIQEQRIEAQTKYMCELLWAPANGMKYKKFPKYGDIFECNKKATPKSTPTGQELTQNVINMFKSSTAKSRKAL